MVGVANQYEIIRCGVYNGGCRVVVVTSSVAAGGKGGWVGRIRTASA